MKLTWNRKEPFLLADGRKIACWSKVRNELNGYRPRKGEADLFRTTPGGFPSMPRPFPAGEWKITGINPHGKSEPYLYPFFIATDAHQALDVWELDARGFYKGPTGERVDDFAYGLHFSSSDWTQGCLRIGTEEDLRWLVANVKKGDSFIVSD
jgi:hypothetical protein